MAEAEARVQRGRGPGVGPQLVDAGRASNLGDRYTWTEPPVKQGFSRVIDLESQSIKEMLAFPKSFEGTAGPFQGQWRGVLVGRMRQRALTVQEQSSQRLRISRRDAPFPRTA